jgi:hypothetical protein
VKRFLIILAVVGIVYWIVKDQPTVSKFVDTLTRPLLGSHAAVEESEHNRVVDEAVPAIAEDEERKVAALKEGMGKREVRDLFGYPNTAEDVVIDGRRQTVWTYRRIHRVLYFEGERVVSIVIQ